MELNLVFEDLGEFVQSYKGRVSVDGMEIDTETICPGGTVLEVKIGLRDELVLIRGNAGVLRSRELHGRKGRFGGIMLVGFVDLDGDSKSLIERMEVRHKAEGIPPFSVERALKEWPSEPPPEEAAPPPPPVAEAPAPLGPTLEMPLPEPDATLVAPPATEPPPPTIRTEVAAQAASWDTSAQDGEVLFAVSDALDPEASFNATDLGMDVIDDAELGDAPTTKRSGLPRLIGLFFAVCAVAAIVVVGVAYFFPELVGLRSGGNEAPAPLAAIVEHVEDESNVPGKTTKMVVGDISTSSEEPVETGATGETEVEEPPVKPPPDTSSTEETSLPPPTPTEAPTPPPAISHSATARRVDGIDWVSDGNTTDVVIRADGAFDPSKIINFRLNSAPGPRLVVQIKEIEASAVAYAIPIEGPRIAGIRSWHHSERKPPELQVVFDLASPQVEMASFEVEANTIVIRLVSP